MNEPHYGHAGTVYGGYMYISGKVWLFFYNNSSKEATVMFERVGRWFKDRFHVLKS